MTLLLDGLSPLLGATAGLLVAATPYLVRYIRRALADHTQEWHQRLTTILFMSGAARTLLIQVTWKGRNSVLIDIPAEARLPDLPSVAASWTRRDPGQDYVDSVLSPLVVHSSHILYPEDMPPGILRDTYVAQKVAQSWVLVTKRDKAGRPIAIVSANYATRMEPTSEVRVQVASEVHQIGQTV